MPHIDIKCYPKHLTEQEQDTFVHELTALVEKHLKATDADLSVAYTEVAPEQWRDLYDREIRPNLGTLIKKPGYEM
ncbi:tautomerase PptA (plasmid) [Deinococcus taeanensis]|uniref:tautomerase PptA n=1 Tax=Deinococcus taeanensis TaxID=2737050 RepID=UPI001CDCEC63|nr:tautomerase PptA [Deinococcus taeanensis]UBV45349.1 tautomerase PptA [Deinococcus taeanensis]